MGYQRRVHGDDALWKLGFLAVHFELLDTIVIHCEVQELHYDII